MKDYQKNINRSHLNSIANKTISKNHFQKLQIYELMLYLMYYDAVVYSALFITCAWKELVAYFCEFQLILMDVSIRMKLLIHIHENVHRKNGLIPEHQN